MKIEGTLLAVKHPESHYAVNVWKVRYKVKVDEQILEREKYVVGLPGCSGDDMEREAAMAVARGYAGRRIKILSAEFVDSAVAAGNTHDNIVNRLKNR
jgi:hypothetical protein